MSKLQFLSLLFALFTVCCNGPETKKETIFKKTESSDKKTSLEVIRIEQEMFNEKSRQNILSVFAKHPDFSKKFLKRSQYPHDSILVNAFYQLVTNPSIDTIYQTCNEHYGDFSGIALEMESMFNEIKKNWPEFIFPKIYTVITGMGQDMAVTDSMVVVGLEFFLAENSKYKPDLPLYMARRYRKEYIVPMVASFMASKYNQTDFLDNSLITEMIFYGKAYYFVEKVIPNISDTILTGYSQLVIEDVKKNQDIIWAHFIDKKLLFETKHETVNRYTGERPTTFEIGNNCPGRIGRWLGWQIVKKYMERNPKLSLQELMKEKDANKILTGSKYKPKMGV